MSKKVKKIIKTIESEIKSIKTLGEEENPSFENLEEEIGESELEEFAEFVTGISSSGPVPIMGSESAVALEQFDVPEAQMSTEEESRAPVYEAGGSSGIAYESGKVYGPSSDGEAALYEGSSSSLPENRTAPSGGIRGSTQGSIRQMDSQQQIGETMGRSPIQQEREPDRRYDLKDEAEGIRSKTDERHHRM